MIFSNYKKEIQIRGVDGLTAQEKEAIKAELISYMQYHPVRELENARLHNHRSLLKVLIFNRTMPIALLIALLFSGSVSYAAENSLPGDILYPVKVNVNEEVRSMVALKAEDKAEWQAKRAERRLEEAEKLALAGEVKSEVILKLEEKFEDHATKVEEKIAKLEEKGDIEAAGRLASALEVTLNAHDRVLASLSASSSATTTGKLIPLGLLVKNKADFAEKFREKEEDDVAGRTKEGIKASAEGKIGAAENKIESTAKFFELKKEVLKGDDLKKAEALIASSTEALAEAKDLLEDGKFEASFEAAQKSMMLSQQAKAAISLHLELGQMIRLKTIISGHASTSDDVDDDLDEDDSDDSDEEEDEDEEEDSEDDNDDSRNRGRGRIELDLNL